MTVIRRSRSVLPFSAAAATLLAVGVVEALFVAEGEARGHIVFHLVFATVLLLLFVAVGLLWRSRPRSIASICRGFLLFALALSTTGTLFEAIGAGGYDAQNAQSQIDWLTAIHSNATPIAMLGLPMIPVGMLAVLILGLRALLGIWSKRRTVVAVSRP